MSNLYRGPHIDASCKKLVHLAKPFQRRRFFLFQPIRNKNRPQRPCLLTDRNEMSNLYRGLHIDASCKKLVHLAKRFQRKQLFLFKPIRNKNGTYMQRPCLLTERNKMSNLYKGPHLDASCQILVHLAKWFERRFFYLSQSETRIAHSGHVC